jgi:hypothetical protein
MIVPLSCPPDATHVPYDRLVEIRAAYTPDAAHYAEIGAWIGPCGQKTGANVVLLQARGRKAHG